MLVLPPPGRVGQELRTDLPVAACAGLAVRAECAFLSGCRPDILMHGLQTVLTLAALIRRGDASHAQAGLGATGHVGVAVLVLWPGLPGGLLVLERHQGAMIAWPG